ARLHDRAKDSCQFVCGEDPDGRDVETLDGEPFLAVNGIQTLSQSTATAAGHIEALREAGAASLRLSPQGRDFPQGVPGYAAFIAGSEAPAAPTEPLRGSAPLGRLSNGFLTGPCGANSAGAAG